MAPLHLCCLVGYLLGWGGGFFVCSHCQRVMPIPCNDNSKMEEI